MHEGPSILAESPGKSALSLWSSPWWYATLSCFMLLALLGTRLISSNDLGFHLRAGQWILQNHKVPSSDPFTYTVPDHDYLDMHWLYQVLLYIQYVIGGYALVTLANISLILLAFAITFRRMRDTGAPSWMRVVLFSVVLLASQERFEVRPEIFSWVFMGLMLWVLESRTNRTRNLLFLLPVIQILWANMEGLFGIGCALLSFYLLSQYLGKGRPDKALVRYSASALALCLANPYFIRGALFPLTHLATLGSPNTFKRTINEFQSPWAWAGSDGTGPNATCLAYMAFSVFLFLLFLGTLRKRKAYDYFLAGAFFALSAAAIRNIPLFMMACAPLAAKCWNDLEWGWLLKCQRAFLARPAAALLLTLFLLATGLRVATGAFYISEREPDQFGLGLNLESQPVNAAGFLVQNHLDGRILNHLGAGGWLDWRGPQKVFIDGRLEVMGEAFYTEYRSSFNRGGLAPLLSKYGIQILFFNPDDAPSWLFQLDEMPEWRPVYLDEAAVIYLHQGYAPQVPALDNGKLLEGIGVSPFAPWEARVLLRAPSPSPWVCFWEDFYKPAQSPMGLDTIGDYYSFTGHFDLAEAVYLENLRRTEGRYWDVFFNLGNLYYHAGRIPEARFCMQRVLETVPGYSNAKKILADTN